MALFDISIEEKLSINAWVKQIRAEINTIGKRMCEEYNFDFFKGVPYKVENRYCWEEESGSESEFNEDNHLSTRPSRSTILSDVSTILDLPSIL